MKNYNIDYLEALKRQCEENLKRELETLVHEQQNETLETESKMNTSEE